MRALRSLTFGILLVVFLFAVLVADAGVWVTRSVLDSDAFARVATAALETAPVRAYLAGAIAGALADEIAPAGEAVPPSVLAQLELPADAGRAQVEGALQPLVEAALADEALAGVRDEAIRKLHATLADTLLGRGLVSLAGDTVTIDLDQLVAAIDERIDPGTPGRLFDIPVRAGLGAVPLLQASALRTVSTVVQVADTLRWLLPIVAIAVGLLALLAARRRRGALAWLGGIAIAVGLLALLVANVASGLLGDLTVADPVADAALGATFDAFLRELVVQSLLLAGLGVVLVVAGAWPRRRTVAPPPSPAMVAPPAGGA